MAAGASPGLRGSPRRGSRRHAPRAPTLVGPADPERSDGLAHVRSASSRSTSSRIARRDLGLRRLRDVRSPFARDQRRPRCPPTRSRCRRAPRRCRRRDRRSCRSASRACGRGRPPRLGAERDQHLAVASRAHRAPGRRRPSGRDRPSRGRRPSAASRRAPRRAGSRTLPRPSARRPRRARASASRLEVGGGRRRHHLDARGRRAPEVRREERHLALRDPARPRERDTHPAGGAVPDEAHLVERLARPAGRTSTCRAAARSPIVALERREAPRRAPRSPRARLIRPDPDEPLGELAFRRVRRPPRRARPGAARSPVSPGAPTSRCSSPGRPQRPAMRERGLGQEVVGVAVRDLRERVRRERGHDEEVRRREVRIRVGAAVPSARAPRRSPQ